MKDPLLVMITVPSQTEGERIARKLVETKLAACVNIMPHLHSIFFWQDKIEEEGEFLLLVKTISDRFEKLVEKVKKIHSYDMPEIIAFPIVYGNPDFLEWIHESTRTTG